jgi:hypothetical protein
MGDHCQVQDDQADALGAADRAEQGKGGSAAGDCGAGGVAAQPGAEAHRRPVRRDTSAGMDTASSL